MNTEVQEIRHYVGEDAFEKGKYYPRHYVHYQGYYEQRKVNTYIFEVESERTYDSYDVRIQMDHHKIISSTCTCPQYHSFQMCKHIAASLLRYQEELFPLDPKEKSLRISKQILEAFYQPPKKQEIHLKKQLFLEVTLYFYHNYYEDGIKLEFRMGEDKLYSLNNKLNQFLRIYKKNSEKLVFGKSFTYDENQYFFSKEDEKILDYLKALQNTNPYYNMQNLLVRTSDFSPFLVLLTNKKFFIDGYGEIQGISYENPVSMKISKEEDYYHLVMLKEGCSFLSKDYSYAIKNHILYQIPEKVRRMIEILETNHLSEILFPEEDFKLFHYGILPMIQDKIILDSTVEDKIVLGVKPETKIYLDFKNGIILCHLKFTYQEQEVDYFEENQKIIRAEETEKEVLQELLTYGFLVNQKQIYMDDIDQIGNFLEESLVELAKKYEVFTSDQMKNTKILKNNPISSSFHIGQDHIMKYDFDLGNINQDEIVDILENLKGKKKYYRLKSGDLLDLSENEELKELEDFVEEMEISKKDLKQGSGIIPKYRAIYLDSLKKEKYHIIKTNNLFDEFIQKFYSYKDATVDFSKQDQKILRDYQEIGVKWLYNIYQCGFGGILADEMGLGKSIQLIYFIKQILKEKKDAKILIVAPTSLIYNWKNEFDKFGSELKYKVFAENKWVRKQELEEVDDINILITTYGLVRQDQEKYFAMNFELVAIDEAQNIKNIHAQMTKAVKQLNANTKIALTGTPLENSVLELWSIFDFIMPGYLASNLNFQKKYAIKDVDSENLKVLDSLNQQIKPFILRRKKKDVVKELPDKIENNIYIDLNQEQKKLYVSQLEKTKKEMDEILANEGFQKGNFKILQLLTKLRQLCIDPRIIYENYQGGSAKIENLISLTKEIIENGHKILLFTSYKMALDIVYQEFTKQNISTYIIDGSVSSKKRMELVEKFNQDDTNVFLITLKSGGTGLNLTSADVVIHLDLWWNPQVENQATDRAHRIGQKKTVEVIKLICKGTIEERILELQNKKKILADTLIEGEDRDQNILSKLTEKDIQKLLSLDNEEE